jgi:hypothetical protein
MAAIPMRTGGVITLLTSAALPGTAAGATDPSQLARLLVVNAAIRAISRIGRFLAHESSLCSSTKASIP